MSNQTLGNRREFNQTLVGLLAAGAALSVQQSYAQETSKPIRIIVPFAPGGSNDIVGRTLAQQLSIRMKRSVIVENVLGSGGAIGSAMVARAEPDGNTLLLISSTFTMNASVMKLSYDPVKSFTPVAMLGVGPSVIGVTAGLPVNSIKELIEYTKKNPGKVFFGSAGVASFQHFAIELFKLRTGSDLTVVHYKGGGPALMDLAAGHVQVSLGSLIYMQSYLRSGKIKLLGVAGPRRVALIQDVPTLKESDVDVEVSNWWGLLAPVGTPSNLLDRFNREANAVLKEPEIQKRFAGEGADPMPMSRYEFERFMDEETSKWANVARETSIKIE
jgi:tripartite-type tricarboxylate transporter receptor subunit TctC